MTPKEPGCVFCKVALSSCACTCSFLVTSTRKHAGLVYRADKVSTNSLLELLSLHTNRDTFGRCDVHYRMNNQSRPEWRFFGCVERNMSVRDIFVQRFNWNAAEFLMKLWHWIIKWRFNMTTDLSLWQKIKISHTNFPVKNRTTLGRLFR